VPPTRLTITLVIRHNALRWTGRLPREQEFTRLLCVPPPCLRSSR